MVANFLIGSDTQTRLSSSWTRAYRSLDHSKVKSIAKVFARTDPRFQIYAWATAFIALQEARHIADYDPACAFSVNEAVDHVYFATVGCDALENLSRELALDLASNLAFRER